jgi:hypothetical protein
VLGSWHVPSFVIVSWGTLKLSSDALSWEPPRVAGLDCSFRDDWLLLRVVCVCLSLPEYLPSLPRPSLSLGLCVS